MVIIKIMLSPSILLGQNDYDHLEITGQDITLASYGGDRPYYQDVRKILYEDEDKFYAPYARVVVMPTHKPAWMITIEKPSKGRSNVELKMLNESPNLHIDPLNLKVNVKSSTIKKDTSEKLKKIWEAMLWEVKYTYPEFRGKNGIQYVFISYVDGKGVMAGSTWTPEEYWHKEKLLALITISTRLNELVSGSSDDPILLEKDINLTADGLLAKLQE
jgi:hypothetical protein